MKNIFNRDIYKDPNGIEPNLFYFTRGSQFNILEGIPTALLHAGLNSEGKLVVNTKNVTDSELIDLMNWKSKNKIKHLTKEIIAKHTSKTILNYVVE